MTTLRRSGGDRIAAALWWAACGAVAAYLLDPQTGRRRRVRARDRAASALRRLGRVAPRKVAYMAGKARGAAHDIGRAVGPLSSAQTADRLPDTSQFLAHKVATELGHEAAIPKGQFNVDAADGVVHLRGRLETTDQITMVIERARKVAGVRDVVSHLTTRE